MNGIRLAAVAVSCVVGLVGCASQGSTASGGSASQSVPYGASKQQYQKALADIEPITLDTQTTAPKGSITGRRMEAYLAAITEWSGGKITFDIAYSNAVASPKESDDALADGRLDLTQLVPTYEPNRYPAYRALSKVSFAGQETPVVGMLQAHGWMLDVAYQTPQISEEFEKQGVKLMLPLFTSGSDVLFCNKPRRTLDKTRGAVVSASGQAASTQLSALGASPTSVPYTELYQSLQRGVVDCSLTPLLVGHLGGFIPAASHVTSAPQAGFGYGLGALGMSTETWQELPLPARQLFFDRLDVFLKTSIEAAWEAMATALDSVEKAGGEVQPFGDRARRALQQANSKLLQQVRDKSAVGDGFVGNVKKSSKTWLNVITTELGYQDVDTSNFDEWYKSNNVGLERYIDHVFKNVLLPHRPS